MGPSPWLHNLREPSFAALMKMVPYSVTCWGVTSIKLSGHSSPYLLYLRPHNTTITAIVTSSVHTVQHKHCPGSQHSGIFNSSHILGHWGFEYWAYMVYFRDAGSKTLSRFSFQFSNQLESVRGCEQVRSQLVTLRVVTTVTTRGHVTARAGNEHSQRIKFHNNREDS